MFADNFERVDDACQNDDGGAVLVIMKDWNIESSLEALFNLKAARRTDILEVDAAVSGCKPSDSFDNLLSILCVKADGHCIHAAKFLEEHCLSLHDRHCGVGADIAKSEHRTSVRHDGYGVCLHRVLVGGFLVVCNHLAGFCNAGGVGQ